jgi:hypothetical protein
MTDAASSATPPPFTEAPLARTDTAWARLWAPLLNDPRDVVFVSTALGLALTLGPAAVAIVVLSALGHFSWWLALPYAALYALGPDKCTLMLHCVVHRPLFNARARALNNFIPWVVCPLWGHTPYSFFAHHMGMHHREGNLLGDLSTTMPYQRDRLSSWLHYWAKFMVFGLPQLAGYHLRGGRKKVLRNLLLGELAYWSVAALLAWFVRWEVAVIVSLAPVVLMRSVMMMGNWGQHAFVDPDAPDDDFKSSITCINSRYNRRAFNDGYHIIHHLRPALHYSEMADEFAKNRALYGEKDAIVFDGLDFFSVWALLMLGRKDVLARAFVRLPGAPERSNAEVIALIERRMAPFGRDGRPLAASAA